MNQHDEELLRAARRMYRALGTLPIYIAVELMDCGFIVADLEKEWDITEYADL